MAAQLDIDLRPEAALTDATRATQRLFVRLAYTRQVPDDDKLRVPTTAAVELDADGMAKFTVKDGAAESAAELHVETAQGVTLFSSNDAVFPAAGSSARLTVVVPVATYRDGGERVNPAEIPVLARSGRFTRFDDTLPDFGRHRLYVAAIRPEHLADGAANPQTAAARSLLGLDGGGAITDFEVMRLDTAHADPAAANAIGLRDCSVRADGSFDFSLPIVGDEVGWLWMLLGPVSYVGYQIDRGDAAGSRVTIVLPVPPADDPSAAEGGQAATAGGGNPPMNYDEQQVIDNPGQFGDDPGTACFPFSNPQRILGERPFFTVLRVDQPEIGGEGSLRVSPPIVLDLAPQIRASAVAASFATATDIRPEGATDIRLATDVAVREADAGVPLAERRAAAADVALEDARLARTARLREVTDSLAQPAAEARSRVDAALSAPVASYFRRWVLARTTNRAPVTPRNPIQWEGAATLYQAGSVVGGHILEHRVQWRSNGYSLGDVAHTLTLAPRQVRRIAKISWRRSETAVRRELSIAQDRVQQTTQRDRDYTDAVQSNLSEWSKGGSESSATGVAGGIGFALGPVVIGGGAAHGQASSSSWQSGGRRVAASEQQSLRDAIRQYADSVRRLESTVITEVSQEEDVEGVSEVVRNVNYCHALTVIYHEILRHYRVDTAFAGVRECLFVPFSVTPFDINKALKWRDKLRGAMLARDLRWALDNLDEVATGWADSNIPPGRRSSHPIRYLAGSAYIRLSIERPRDRNDDEKMEDYLAQWSRLAPLMGTSVSAVLAQLARADRDRDAYFQKEIATGMAAKWSDRLKFVVGSHVVDNADFTLASTYRFGGTVRVDFTVPVDGRFTREDLQNITFLSSDRLPVGSVADLVRVQFAYFTDHFDATAESVQTANDLIKPDTGEPDADGAVTGFPLTAWERQDLRRVIEDAVDQLIVHLNANMIYYHKVIWWLMDRDELFMLLDGFTAPYGRRLENDTWVEDTGRSLASVVEREPLGILGNSLVFRAAGGVFLGIDGHESPLALDSYYRDSDFRPQPLRVSLPTDGLYAQALMDPCEACEEHFGSTDWVLADREPELESLVDQLGTRRATPVPTTPSQMPETLINLQNVPPAPDPAGLGGILSAVTNASAFRDMAGLAGTQANARAAFETAAGLATNFGNQAAALELAKLAKAEQATKAVDRKLASIKNAKDKGLTTEQEAAQQTKAALAAMNPDATRPDAPHTDPAINAAIEAAKDVPGSTIEATNSEGSTKVTLGKDDVLKPLIIDVRTDGETRAFGSPSDFTGVTSLSVRGKDLPTGSSLRWSVPPAAAGRYSITQTTNAGTSVVTVSGIRPGRTDIDVEALDADGVRVASMKLPLSIPQFIEIDDANPDLDAFMTRNDLGAIKTAILDEARTVTELLVTRTANVRLVWKSQGTKVPTHVTSDFVTTAKIGDRDITAGKMRYGTTEPGRTSNDIGDTVFDESILIFPQSYLTAGGPTTDINLVLNGIVQAVIALQSSDPDHELWLTRLFGRLIGESLAHEIFHALLPVPFDHNVNAAGVEVATGDIMDAAEHRSLTERTGIVAAIPLPTTLDNLSDTGIGNINRLTDIVNVNNLTFVQTNFPVPPVKPFDI